MSMLTRLLTCPRSSDSHSPSFWSDSQRVSWLPSNASDEVPDEADEVHVEPHACATSVWA
eukprot:7075086-Prymnesium_polylepis.1